MLIGSFTLVWFVASVVGISSKDDAIRFTSRRNRPVTQAIVAQGGRFIGVYELQTISMEVVGSHIDLCSVFKGV